MRGGPGIDYLVVDELNSGEHVKVVGQVIGKPWYTIYKNGVGRGFVYVNLLGVAPIENQSDAETQTRTAVRHLTWKMRQRRVPANARW